MPNTQNQDDQRQKQRIKHSERTRSLAFLAKVAYALEEMPGPEKKQKEIRIVSRQGERPQGNRMQLAYVFIYRRKEQLRYVTPQIETEWIQQCACHRHQYHEPGDLNRTLEILLSPDGAEPDFANNEFNSQPERITQQDYNSGNETGVHIRPEDEEDKNRQQTRHILAQDGSAAFGPQANFGHDPEQCRQKKI